ncbi:copper resistance CopC/CopD family protein, partial [Peterkaempfera griseoplana]|uniref:copper resistance CopC/CopD family protein n=1 Tax=Peterkaempfera griseoplana TaxID=66896 RepID=UPI0006E34859
LLGGAGTAAAHAALAGSAPAADAVLDTAPREVVLTFSEGVSVPPDGLRVLGPGGLRVDDRRPGHAGGDGRTARVALGPGLPQGTYVVSWRVVSADSHPVSGGFTFSVGHESAAPAVAANGSGALVGVAYGVGRGLAYAGFVVLAGGALLMRGSAAVRRLVSAGWAVLVMATAGLLVLRTPYESGGFGWAAVRETLAGRPALALLARLLLVLPLGPLLRRGAPGAAVAVPAVAAGATWAASEHAATGPQTALAVPLDLLHLLAASVWLGGLAALLVTLVKEPPAVASASAARFSRWARAAVAVLVATGAYQSWRQVGSWHALADTGYGRLLAAKLAAVGLLLAAAWYSRRWTAGPAVSGAGASGAVTVARLRWSVAAETAAGAVVLALTALLTSSQPARTAVEFTAATAAPRPTVYAQVPFDTGLPGGRGRGTVEIVLDPGRAGDNSLQAVVLTRGGALAVVPELRIRMALPDRGVGPLQVPLEQRGAAWEADDLRVPLPGRWTLTVVVRTSDVDEDTGSVQVEIPA